MSFLSDLQKRFVQRDVVMRLILINVGVFLVVNFYLLFAGMHHADGNSFWMLASSDIGWMMTRPWTLFTYQFTHEDVGHVFFNMLALYFMGGLFVRMVGQRSVVPIYLFGGIAGYVLFAFSYNFISRFAVNGDVFMLGASASVMAITFAAATYAPRMEVYLFGAFKLELRWLAFVLLVLDLVSIRKGVNSGGHIAHIGGAAFGYFYAAQLLKGKNMLGWLERFFEKLKSLFKRHSGLKVHVNHARPKSDEQFNVEKKARQKRVDVILDKISRSGYDSLSKEEKEFLFSNSQK